MKANLALLLTLRFVGIAMVAAGGLTVANSEDSAPMGDWGLALAIAGLALNIVCRRLSRRPLRELALRADESARNEPPKED